MAAVTPSNALRGPRPFASEPPETRRLSVGVLEASGLPAPALFGRTQRAWRRIDSVSAQGLEVQGPKGAAFLPRHVAPAAVEGQWLRFDRLATGQVRVGVDLAATLAGESRLVDLYQRLAPGR